MPGAAGSNPVPSIALFRAVEDIADNIKPEEKVIPAQVGIPSGAKKVGDATEAMKRIYWVVMKFTNDRKLGESELILRAAHTAFGFEVGSQFDCFGVGIGVTSTWEVYAQQ